MSAVISLHGQIVVRRDPLTGVVTTPTAPEPEGRQEVHEHMDWDCDSLAEAPPRQDSAHS